MDARLLTTIEIIRREHARTRRQFIFMLLGQTMLMNLPGWKAGVILAEMSMFPVEELPEDPIMLYQWAKDWVDYATQPPGNPDITVDDGPQPPPWFKDEWISKEW